LNFRSFTNLIWLIIFAFIYHSSAVAESSKETIHFAIMDLHPYGFFAKDGTPKGYHYQIAQAILKEAGLKGQTIISPLKRINKNMFVSKTLDCSIFGAVPYVQDQYKMIEEIGVELNFGFIPQKHIVIEQYSDLKNLKIGVPLGVHIGSPFDTDNNLIKMQAKDYQSGMLMLKHNRFDAIAGVIGSLQFSAYQADILPHEYGNPWVLKTLPTWLVCRPNFLDEALEKKLRLSVIKLRQNGTINRIKEKCLGILKQCGD